MEKVYAVQVFYEVYHGIRADKPLLYGCESVARECGEALARDRHGVLVYEQVIDANRGDQPQPMILAKYGNVPNMFA
jgi:hypothetical protein